MLVKKLGVNVLLPMLWRLRFSKSFRPENHVYCGLVSSKLFLNSQIVLVVIVQLL